jgi:hypothetical protein
MAVPTPCLPATWASLPPPGGCASSQTDIEPEGKNNNKQTFAHAFAACLTPGIASAFGDMDYTLRPF